MGGNYDSLFLQQPPESIAFIYKSLCCLHSLQPDSADDEARYSPSVPALKPRGFVTWQTIQILLGPEEHAPFIQNALKAYDVIDPVTKTPFPKTIPRTCFPPHPDPIMVKWHEKVTERLRIQAENAVGVAERNQHSRPPSAVDDPATPDDRVGAVRYTSDPHHHAHEERPKIVRSFTKAAPPKLKEGANAVALTVRNIANPYLWSGHNNSSDHGSSSSRTRRRSRDNRADDVSENDQTNIPPSHATARAASHHGAGTPSRRHSLRPSPRNSTRRAPRRSRGSESMSSSRSSRSTGDEKSSPPERRKPRRHRSHDPPMSEYFGRRDGDRERPSSQYLSDMGQGAPHHRRKSDDHGRAGAPGRERAHFSVSEGSQASKGKPTPEEYPHRGSYQHRASIPHYRPTQGYMRADADDEDYRSGRSPPGSRTSGAFRDPWVAEDYAKRGSDAQPLRSTGQGQYGTSTNTTGPRATMSSSGSSLPDTATAGRSSTHRYVTPVNGVQGRQYPSESGWR